MSVAEEELRPRRQWRTFIHVLRVVSNNSCCTSLVVIVGIYFYVTTQSEGVCVLSA